MSDPSTLARRTQRALEEFNKLPPDEQTKIMVEMGTVDKNGNVLMGMKESKEPQPQKLEDQIMALVNKQGKNFGSREAAWLWLGIVDKSMGKTPYQAIIDGQGDMVHDMIDNLMGPSPSYT